MPIFQAKFLLTLKHSDSCSCHSPVSNMAKFSFYRTYFITQLFKISQGEIIPKRMELKNHEPLIQLLHEAEDGLQEQSDCPHRSDLSHANSYFESPARLDGSQTEWIPMRTNPATRHRKATRHPRQGHRICERRCSRSSMDSCSVHRKMTLFTVSWTRNIPRASSTTST